MIAQLVCYYLPPTPLRLREYSTALQHNINNTQISEIHLFQEDSALEACEWPEAKRMRELWKSPKIKSVGIRKRQTYSNLIDYANENLQGYTTMISSSDIFYDATLSFLERINFSKNVVCLSRIELSEAVHTGYTRLALREDGNKMFVLTDEVKSFSQDTWVFKPPIKKINADFYMGIMRCDNRIAFEFNKIGFQPINPCNNIRSYHLHDSAVKTYTSADVVPGPVLFIKPPYDL